MKAWKRIKELDEENVRLDFIISSYTYIGLDEGLFSEDDFKLKERRKSDEVPIKMLNYWKSVLPYEECLYYLECFSTHFNGLNLTIMSSKLYSGHNFHYIKKRVVVPNEFDPFFFSRHFYQPLYHSW